MPLFPTKREKEEKMKIGSGWTKTSKEGNTFISIALDDTFLELFPQLKNCNVSLGHIKEGDRKNENSPAWTVSLSVKKQKTEEEKEELQKDIEDLVDAKSFPY